MIQMEYTTEQKAKIQEACELLVAFCDFFKTEPSNARIEQVRCAVAGEEFLPFPDMYDTLYVDGNYYAFNTARTSYKPVKAPQGTLYKLPSAERIKEMCDIVNTALEADIEVAPDEHFNGFGLIKPDAPMPQREAAKALLAEEWIAFTLYQAMQDIGSESGDF